MARNFDSELPEDLTFTAAGETFTLALASPQVLGEFEDLEKVTTGAEAVARARLRTTTFIQEGDRERWEKLLDEGRIPYRQLEAIQTWMVEIQTGRPTVQPSPSDSGPGGTAVTSRGKRS